MSTEANTTAIPSDILSDGEAVVEAIMSGRKLDPKVAQRVERRAKKITEVLRKKHGTLDIAVPAIRELRDS